QRDLLSAGEIEKMLTGIEEEINEAVAVAEKTPDMAPDSFFDYMAADLTPRLQVQRADLLRHTSEKGK
ncbi:MAG: pyruvate dehydrogenase (acetyl-transferring) E1 component subunit alpha, partial [Ktedonobacteraceae bacterium]